MASELLDCRWAIREEGIRGRERRAFLLHMLLLSVAAATFWMARVVGEDPAAVGAGFVMLIAVPPTVGAYSYYREVAK